MWTRAELEKLARQYEERKLERQKAKKLKKACKLANKRESHGDWLLPLLLIAILDEIRRKL